MARSAKCGLGEEGHDGIDESLRLFKLWKVPGACDDIVCCSWQTLRGRVRVRRWQQPISFAPQDKGRHGQPRERVENERFLSSNPYNLPLGGQRCVKDAAQAREASLLGQPVAGRTTRIGEREMSPDSGVRAGALRVRESATESSPSPGITCSAGSRLDLATKSETVDQDQRPHPVRMLERVANRDGAAERIADNRDAFSSTYGGQEVPDEVREELRRVIAVPSSAAAMAGQARCKDPMGTSERGKGSTPVHRGPAVPVQHEDRSSVPGGQVVRGHPPPLCAAPRLRDWRSTDVAARADCPRAGPRKS